MSTRWVIKYAIKTKEKMTMHKGNIMNTQKDLFGMGHEVGRKEYADALTFSDEKIKLCSMIE